MEITYKTSLELSPSELANYYDWLSPITFEETYLLPRKPEELAKSIFSVFAFHEEEVVGSGLLYPSCEKTQEIKWKGLRLFELGTLYLSKKIRRSSLGEAAIKFPHRLIDMRLDYVEKHNYFPVTVTRHKGMDRILEGKAIRVEDINGEYSELKPLIRKDCPCTTAEQKALCKNCPNDERSLWVYLRFVLKKY